MKEVAAGVPVHFLLLASVKVQVMQLRRNLPGANGRYVGDSGHLEFVPDDAGRRRAGARVRLALGEHTTPSRRCVKSITSAWRLPDRRARAFWRGFAGVDNGSGENRRGTRFEELQELLAGGDFKTSRGCLGMGEERARAVVDSTRTRRATGAFCTRKPQRSFPGKPWSRSSILRETWRSSCGSTLTGAKARRPDPLGRRAPRPHDPSATRTSCTAPDERLRSWAGASYTGADRALRRYPEARPR